MKIKQLIEFSIHSYLNEGYIERVQSFVDDLTGGTPLSKEEFESKLETFGNPLERKGSPTAWKEFKKDAVAYAKTKNLLSAKKRVTFPYYVADRKYHDEKIGVTEDDIQQISRILSNYASNTFPHSDSYPEPLEKFARGKEWNSHEMWQKLVPIACKKEFGTKSFDAYLAQMWDDSYGDAKSDHETYTKAIAAGKKNVSDSHLYQEMGGDKAKNPYK